MAGIPALVPDIEHSSPPALAAVVELIRRGPWQLIHLMAMHRSSGAPARVLPAPDRHCRDTGVEPPAQIGVVDIRTILHFHTLRYPAKPRSSPFADHPEILRIERWSLHLTRSTMAAMQMRFPHTPRRFRNCAWREPPAMSHPYLSPRDNPIPIV